MNKFEQFKLRFWQNLSAGIFVLVIGGWQLIHDIGSRVSFFQKLENRILESLKNYVKKSKDEA